MTASERPDSPIHAWTGDPRFAVVVNDAQGNVVYANPRADEIFGNPDTSLIGRAVESLSAVDGAWTRIGVVRGESALEVRCFWDLRDRRSMEEELRQEKAFALVLQKIAVAANEAATVEDALFGVMEIVCQYTGCPVGHLFMVNERNPSELVFDGRWYLADRKYEVIRDTRRHSTLARGRGTAGRALETAKPTYAACIEELGTWPEREKLLAELGIRGGFALPISSGGNVIAVLACLAYQPLQNDRTLTELTTFIWSQMSRVIDRKLLEKEQVLAREKALDASSAKSRFLANMSHELRTPLNAMTGMAHLLMRTNLDDEQSEYARTMISSADALLALITDVLDFSKIEAGKLEVHANDFRLDELLRDTAGILAYDAQKKGIVLSTVIDENVPSEIRGDAGHLRQVLVNLIGNAIKFTDAGAVKIRVHRLGYSPEGTVVRFEVRDTGMGIPAVARGKIFQAFSQVDGSSTRRHAGTGLGLSISKRLVELMGGKIGFDTTEGMGSSFWFYVPLEPVKLDPVSAQQPDREKSRLAPCQSSEGARILVVEDDPVSRMMVVRMLEKCGYSASAVDNGNAAVAAVVRGDCDVVLMDCNMPQMDGFATTREIRKFEQKAGTHVKILATTANALKGDRDKCLNAEMDDYIAKPIDPDRLCALIEQHLRGPGKFAEIEAKFQERIMDSEALARLRQLNSASHPDILRELAQIFFETSPLRIERIRMAVRNGDPEVLAREAHDLSSASGSLGATRLRGICAELDALGRTRRVASAAPLLKTLEAAYEDFVAELRAEVASPDRR